MSLPGLGATTTDPCPCPLGWCHSYPVDLPPYSCVLTCKWTAIWAKGDNCLFLYVARPYSPRAGPLGHPTTPLVSDPRMVYPVNVYDFQGQAAHRLHKQHIQMGLRKGMAVLVYYRVEGGPHVNAIFQAVLIAHESAATRGKKNDNKLWKRVVPSETEFAWLPPDIAWAFCSDALRRRRDCQYLAFHQAHMGLHGRACQANIFIVDMVFLGDTRSAEELAVFTNMAPWKAVLRVRSPSGWEVHTHFPRWAGTIAGGFSEVTPICPACL